jgi:hypothetical protein
MQMIAPHWRAVLLLVGSVAAQDGIMPVHPQVHRPRLYQEWV